MIISGRHYLPKDIDTNLERWRPLLELHLPVEHDGGGDDDEVRAPNVLFTGEMAEERNGLKEYENIFLFDIFFINKNRCKNRTHDLLIVSQVLHKTTVCMYNCIHLYLNSFSQTHFVCKNSVKLSLVQRV